jgi:hypothetical protein
LVYPFEKERGGSMMHVIQLQFFCIFCPPINPPKKRKEKEKKRKEKKKPPILEIEF